MNEVTLDEPRVALLTKKRVSELLGVSERTVSRIQEKGLLREKVRVGNVILFSPESVTDLREYFQRKLWYQGAGNDAKE